MLEIKKRGIIFVYSYLQGEIWMTNTYTAIIKQDGDWWIGWIEEVPGVNCQEKSREELVQTLKVTLKEALEFNRQEAIQSAVSEYTEEPLTIWNEPGLSST